MRRSRPVARLAPSFPSGSHSSCERTRWTSRSKALEVAAKRRQHRGSSGGRAIISVDNSTHITTRQAPRSSAHDSTFDDDDLSFAPSNMPSKTRKGASKTRAAGTRRRIRDSKFEIQDSKFEVKLTLSLFSRLCRSLGFQVLLHVALLAKKVHLFSSTLAFQRLLNGSIRPRISDEEETAVSDEETVDDALTTAEEESRGAFTSFQVGVESASCSFSSSLAFKWALNQLVWRASRVLSS